MVKGQSRRVVLCWLRRDLRFEDNRALAGAFRLAKQHDAEVLIFFIFDRTILKRLEEKDDARVTFIHDTLMSLRARLRKYGSDLLCVFGDPGEVWKKLLAGDLLPLRTSVVGATFSSDYEPSAIARDEKVLKLLSREAIPVLSFKDQVIFERDEVTKDDGKPYTVFTPYSKKWLARLDQRLSELDTETYAADFKRLYQGETGSLPTLEALGFTRNLAVPIPDADVEAKTLKNYAVTRDLPAQRGTSHVGLHLRFGTVSVRDLVARARKLNAHVWLNELIWREFFMQILWHFPRVVEGAFRPEYDRIQWRNNEAEFQRWCEGKTGYPLVDAGLRELNATGFMHNRVRMVAASFLVKHLLIDWRWGEAYFARKLLDFELSSNNGNWQWVAGSGCDAAPYFRVFNPELQLKKFDRGLEYVKKWVPEFGSDEYVAPIVDHAEARARVLRVYAIVKS